MASSTNANLFGEDTDSSSNESIDRDTSNRLVIGDADSSGVGEEPKKKMQSDGGGDTATTTPSDDDNVQEQKKAKASEQEAKDEAHQSAFSVSNVTPSKNAALFGDDDTSEDDEFDGDDGIVGLSSGVVKLNAPTVGKSMNQKLGLDSDSDEAMTKEDSRSGEAEKEESQEKYVPPRRMELLNLGININNTSSAQQPIYHITKLPNLVGINSTPYDGKTHDMEKEEEYFRGSGLNMIRWRYKTDDKGDIVRDEHGNPVRESNTRLVKWSDGSYTLYVGREVLDVDNLDSSIPSSHPDEKMAGFAGINGYLYVSQKACIRPSSKRELEGPPNEEEEENYSAQEDALPNQTAGTVLECVGPISSRLALRPSSLASDAHRNLKLAVQKRNVKRARIAEIVTEVDPEREKLARIKGKEDLAKSRARSSGGGRRPGGGGGGRRRGMNAGYLEEEDDYDGVNLSRLKRQTMHRGDYSDEDEEEMDYGESSDEEEEEWMSKKKRKRGAAAAKAARDKLSASPKGQRGEHDESSEEGEVVFGDDDDDDEEDAFVKKRAGGAKKQAVLDDDDDE